MQPDSKERWKHADKRNAAVHEAGHATVAIALGTQVVRSWLIEEKPTNPLFHRYWGGRTQFDATGFDKSLVLLAGIVAERLDNPGFNSHVDTDCDFDWDDLAEEIACSADRLSPTDAEGLPRNALELSVLIHQSTKLLRRHSKLHREITKELLENMVFSKQSWEGWFHEHVTSQV